LFDETEKKSTALVFRVNWFTIQNVCSFIQIYCFTSI